jgi:hypothetical protein
MRAANSDDTRDTNARLQDTVMKQVRQRLLDYSAIKRPGMKLHAKWQIVWISAARWIYAAR